MSKPATLANTQAPKKLTAAERTAKLLAVRPVNHFNSPIPKSKAAARALKTENDRLRAALLALYVVASKYAVVPDAEYCAITNAATLTESA